MGYRLWAVAGVLAAALVGGCGTGKPEPPPIVPVEGVVLLEGRPLNKVVVQFQPATNHDPEYLATGVTDEKGRFKLTCKGQPGACSGENQVAVKEADFPPDSWARARRNIRNAGSTSTRWAPGRRRSTATSRKAR